ncbi:MAG: hypothetical protein HY671_07550 [Chloroflexi bacterium]|nr:hypothetical protein [Chloroflexota bacterium]
MQNRYFEIAGERFVTASANGAGGSGPAGQAQLAFDRLKDDLKKLGSRLENILRITVYMKSADMLRAVGEVRKRVFQGMIRPASASIVCAAFRPEDALVEIEATAIARADIVEKQAVEFDPPRLYLKALVCGRFAFLSGTGGEGRTEEEHAESAFKTLGLALEEQGASLRDLRRVTIYLKRMGAVDAVDGVFRRYFKRARPYLEIIPADGFAREDMLLEIDGTGVVGRVTK